MHDQDECERTLWLFFGSGSTSVTLVKDGQIHKEAKAKSDRLRVTEECSLVIKKVTEEDVGVYLCRQFRLGQQQGSYSEVYLSVVTMTEHQDNDEVKLDCSVETYGGCTHTAKWLLQGQDVDKDHRDINTSQSSCSASTFSPQSSGEDAGKVTTVSPTWTTVRMRAAGETTNTASEDNHTEPEENHKVASRLILVSVVLAALIITVVTVNIWTRAKGSKAQTEENMEQNDEDEDEDEVNYVNDGGASASV
ncbi:hypothetical protein JOQ06_004642 [Pogonophryne albipinna]|uniref:Ig-like domain-containing protein n=1 Tax=Pogonophryne albipinna TaxID=1090488 RepID=A0AAD6FBW0_9TELE|nr:hypothetical protein JOQ06_004642 [Pogonophryne albipinna]